MQNLPLGAGIRIGVFRKFRYCRNTLKVWEKMYWPTEESARCYRVVTSGFAQAVQAIDLSADCVMSTVFADPSRQFTVIGSFACKNPRQVHTGNLHA